jgi:formamidopyrimidine-DNA glycosylase
VPELPDVEGFRRALADQLPGRTVCRVRVSDPGVLRNTTPQALGRSLGGHTFAAPRRRGKWLILPTDGPILLVHSGMTGRPFHTVASAEAQPYERLVVDLDRGQLRYADLRKLRGIWLAAEEAGTDDVIGPQGPDALAVGRREFAAALGRRRGALKPALMDQRTIAGLGNLLADEICWQARVNPAVRVGALSDDEVDELFRTTRRVLRTAVRHGCVPALARWLTGARDDPDPSCPRCGTPLRRSRSNGRATLHCPRCQPWPGDRSRQT